jgi:quercetin dioxygenase-like cupin family protein
MLNVVKSIARCSVIAALALSAGALADDAKPQPQRTILQRHNQSGVPGKEIVVGTALLPTGTSIGFHDHPGDEVGYVIRGTVIRKARGEPDVTLKAGDSFVNPRGLVHSIVSADGGDSLVVSTWIVDKGKPMASPVP